jgi:hypothetical protein
MNVLIILIETVSFFIPQCISNVLFKIVPQNTMTTERTCYQRLVELHATIQSVLGVKNRAYQDLENENATLKWVLEEEKEKFREREEEKEFLERAVVQLSDEKGVLMAKLVDMERLNKDLVEKLELITSEYGLLSLDDGLGGDDDENEKKKKNVCEMKGDGLGVDDVRTPDHHPMTSKNVNLRRRVLGNVNKGLCVPGNTNGVSGVELPGIQ